MNSFTTWLMISTGDIEFAYQDKECSIGSGQDGLYYIAETNKIETEKGVAGRDAH